MKLNRRSILGLFGGAAVAGPQVAAKMTADITSLDVPGVSLLGTGEEVHFDGPSPGSSVSWAMKRKAKRALFSALDWDDRRVKHSIHRLDANTAALVSVSMHSKLRISRDKQWKIFEEQEDRWLENLIANSED